MKKKKAVNLAKEYLMINVALIIMALGFVWFFIPSKIAAGGVSGISTVIYHTFGFPVGVTMLCLNIPLFIIGVIIFGRGYGFKTLYATVALSVFIDLLSVLTGLKPITSNILLSALYGGLLEGIGLGIILKLGGSTGGTDIIAQVLNKIFKIPTGYALMAVDSFVLVTAGIVFGMETALYAIIALFTIGRMINLVSDGIRYSKMAFIISDKFEELQNVVLYEIDRGGTVFRGNGLYTNKDKKVIMTVIKDNEVHDLKEKIREHDPDAFVIITDTHQVLGEGFKKNQ